MKTPADATNICGAEANPTKAPFLYYIWKRGGNQGGIMPKVILGEEYRREDALWEYIDSRIGRRCQYKNDRECAEKAAGVGPDTFSRWRNTGFPRFFYALCRMFQRTHITDRQLCRIFGVEYKGETKNDCETAV